MHYPRYCATRRLRADVQRAAHCIRDCQTAALGAHVERCECGEISRIRYNSCRHRSCPQCQGGRRARWLEQLSSQLLPCDHVHVIFTVPDPLNSLWQFNRALFSNLLMCAARESLDELLSDPKYLGARPGIISALHTWGRNLARYMTGGPLSNRRIHSATETEVAFWYRDHRDGAKKLMRLTPDEFLTRWFEHIPPRGLRMIRRSGLYANSCSKKRAEIQRQLRDTLTELPATKCDKKSFKAVFPLEPERCPLCNTAVLCRDATIILQPHPFLRKMTILRYQPP